MQKAELITLGSDPELFLEDLSGKVISAIGRIGGTKDKPLPIKELGKGYAVQEDNVLLEYNTPPVRSTGQWSSAHQEIRNYLQIMVGQLGLRLSTKASHSMTEDQLDHPLAFVFGCEPDYNVWKMKWNIKPKCDDPFLRSAGGHIHVGYTNPNQADSIRLGRLMDYFIGAPLAAIDPDKKRRLLYGRPGAIRFKPYGLEYRTPSNFWTLDPFRVEAVYGNVQECVSMLKSYDSFASMAETARAFLAGEANGWDDNYFTSRAYQYSTAKKQLPKWKPKTSFIFDEGLNLTGTQPSLAGGITLGQMQAIVQGHATIPFQANNPEDGWTAFDNVNDEDQEDESQ